MIKVRNVETWGFEHAIRGMRNPMNSWNKSDSEEKYWCNSLGPKEEPHYCNDCGYDMCNPYMSDHDFVIGPNDLDLMQKLYRAGTEHRKYMRQIFVSMDIIAPLYWWKQADQFKVGITTNSCSTMHKIADKEFTIDDFSHEHLMNGARAVLDDVIGILNFYRKEYLDKKTKDLWWQMIQLLPSSYNQRRTVTMNYENAVTIINQRTGHKLNEWNDFTATLFDLPYMAEIIEG